MTGGQVDLPLVIRTANGGGVGFGAQHSQSTEAWTAQIPGLKTVSPSGPAEAYGLLKTAIRDDDPVVFFEHKALYSSKQDFDPDGSLIPLGKARVVQPGGDATLVTISAMVSKALEAAALLRDEGVTVEVIDLRSLVPLDAQAVLESVARTGRFMTVEESPRQFGWGGELASIVADECFFDLDAPVRRLAAPNVPLPAAPRLEREVIPQVERIAAAIRDLAAI
jgi:pyruvate/2-oxoglutarate/acetoin dehydrogenase E1 component